MPSPIQFPTFSTDEQTERSKRYAQDTYYPYSYSIALPNAATTYPSTDAGPAASIGAIHYNTIAFQADNNMAISAIAVNLSVQGTFAFGTLIQSLYVMRISTNPVFTYFNVPTPAAAIAQPTPPGDKGNDIYTWSAVLQSDKTTAGNVTNSFQNFNYLPRFQPYNIILKFNQILYIHMGVDVNTMNSNLGLWTVSVIFYMLPTGAKT